MNEEHTIVNTEEEIRAKIQKYRSYLTHMLGAEWHVSKSQWGYRNYYCAEVGGKDEQDLMKLAAIGLVRRGPTINEGTSVYFFATEKGMDAAGLTREQKARALEQ
jgi:hypothetical protein